MKLERGKGELELGFKNPPAGTYIWMVDEGIKLYTNENSGKTSLLIPMIVDQVVDGDELALQQGSNKATHFVPIESGFGEKQLGELMTITGVIDDAMKAFPDDFDPKSERAETFLNLKMQGKFLKATHTIRKDGSGTERVNFTKFEAVGGGKKKDADTPAPEEWD